jgi:cytidylate kinase
VEVNAITISRQYGAGASEMARMLSGRFGFRVVEKDLLQAAAQRSGIDLAKIERVYEQRPGFQDLRVYREKSEKYITAVNEVLDDLVRQGSVIIVGRAANLALLSHPNVFNIRLIADFQVRLKRVMQREVLNEASARQKITEADYARETYYRYLYNIMPDDPLVYDMILNTSRMLMEEAAALVSASFEALRAARST